MYLMTSIVGRATLHAVTVITKSCSNNESRNFSYFVGFLSIHKYIKLRTVGAIQYYFKAGSYVATACKLLGC